MPRGLNLSHLPEQSVHPEGLRPPGDLPGLRQELCHEALLVDLPGASETFLEVSSVCRVVRGEAEQGLRLPARFMSNCRFPIPKIDKAATSTE